MSGRRGAADGPGWRIDPGRYELHVGTSSAVTDHVVGVDVATG
jgi:hypothetical protein